MDARSPGGGQDSLAGDCQAGPAGALLVYPELFELAAEQTDPQVFAGDLKQVLARKYEELAQVEAELENFAAACDSSRRP